MSARNENETLREAVDTIIAEWSSRWMCRFAGDKARRAWFFRACREQMRSADDLLAAWRTFVDSWAGQRAPEADQWVKFLRKLGAQGRERRAYDRRRDDCDLCNGRGYMTVLCPRERGNWEPDANGYRPGAPYGARCKTVDAVELVCKCADPGDGQLRAAWADLRNAHAAWFVRARAGTWALDPTPQCPAMAMLRWQRMWHAGEWNPLAGRDAPTGSMEAIRARLGMAETAWKVPETAGETEDYSAERAAQLARFAKAEDVPEDELLRDEGSETGG